VRCYLDDDLDSDLLLRLASAHGHQLVSPRAVSLRGSRDSVHLAYAVRQGMPVVSGNTGDFESLHDLALALGGQHFGILLVYGERDDKAANESRTHPACIKPIRNAAGFPNQCSDCAEPVPLVAASGPKLHLPAVGAAGNFPRPFPIVYRSCHCARLKLRAVTAARARQA